jgi:hypothetical protein
MFEDCEKNPENFKEIRQLYGFESLKPDHIKEESQQIHDSSDKLSTEILEEALDMQIETNDVMLTEIKPLDEEYESETPNNSHDDDDDDSDDSMSTSENKSNRKSNRRIRKSKSAGSEDNESSDDDDDTNKSFVCDACPKRFKKPSLLARHVKTHDPQKRPHECSKCQKRFPSQVALVRHDILHSELVERSKINRAEPQDFICVICANTFKSSDLLSSHLKTHKNQFNDEEVACKLCNEIFTNFTDIARHSKNHIENATHQCAICNKLFVVGDELIDHFLRHKGEL